MGSKQQISSVTDGDKVMHVVVKDYYRCVTLIVCEAFQEKCIS